MEEREIERVAAELGAQAAKRIDASQTARAVVGRLRATRSQPRWWARQGLLRIAAAVALLVGGGLFWFNPPASRPVRLAEHDSMPVPADVEAFSSTELGEVLDSLSWETPASELAGVQLQDLSTEQLRVLLGRMEG